MVHLKIEGSEFVTKCDKRKLRSSDGKFYKPDIVSGKNFLGSGNESALLKR